MHADFANAIAETAQENGYDVTVLENYRGRGMQQSTTALRFSDQGEFMAAFILVGMEWEGAYDLHKDHDAEEFIDAARSLRYDSLGKGQIAY